jgi:diguanylate cyclase (GGDEF)-like protein
MTHEATPGVIVHPHPVEGEADELLGFQRVMFWLRLLGIAIVLGQGWLYTMLHPALLVAAIVIEGLVVATQGRLFRPEMPLAAIRRRATVLLVADLAAAYLIGTTYTADPQWIGFFFYPLMSLEATLIGGLWGGVAVTVLSVVIYLAQLVLYVSLGHEVTLRSALGGMSMIAMTGGFITFYAHLVQRGRDHLRAMLDLTSALARHESQADAIHHLDRRLHAAIGARVRSIAVRQTSGGYRVTHWRTAEERVVTTDQLRRAFGDGDELRLRLEAGDAVTLETDAWSVITASLGLPEWASAVTMVPIVAEGRWVGVLPVLWPTRTAPDDDQLRLLYGLAGQMGLALARGELEQMRRNATVDPLTGLLNRRAIGAELEAFIARAARSCGHTAVLLCELEHDGALTGPTDTTIAPVAQALRGELRSGDVAGRHDDDRIMVIAADADATAARSLAARIADAIAGLPGSTGLRVHIGVAAFPDDARSAAGLVDAAALELEATAPRQRARAYFSPTTGATAG